MTTTLGLLLATLIGVSLGLLGGGGAILAVPIFTYVMGFGAKEAIASSLVVVGVTSLFGTAEHWREGHVRLRTALIFGVFAMIGAYLGAQLATLFSDAAQLILFAVVMLVAAFFMFRDNNKEESDEDEGGSEPEDYSVAGVSLGCAAGLTVLGVAIGVLTGLVGVGGGFLIVPALVLFGKLPVKDAVGSSVLVIAMNSASGFVGYLGKVEIQWGTIVLFTALAVAGSFAGTYLVRFVPANALQKAFAVFLVAMAIFILYENRQAIPLV
ncbi:MAG TPA: sulfite exporter TauE/SafE family protein [Rubrobacteraceae bacterium]|nr:sulfite exporter TauE/SafE family protein [Rubrobacteraceae bacterium]